MLSNFFDFLVRFVERFFEFCDLTLQHFLIVKELGLRLCQLILHGCLFVLGQLLSLLRFNDFSCGSFCCFGGSATFGLVVVSDSVGECGQVGDTTAKCGHFRRFVLAIAYVTLGLKVVDLFHRSNFGKNIGDNFLVCIGQCSVGRKTLQVVDRFIDLSRRDAHVANGCFKRFAFQAFCLSDF